MSASDIPDGITKEDVEEAAAAIYSDGFHGFHDSEKYDVIINGRPFPPKAIIGVAARRLAGRILKPHDFSGGLGSKCFRILHDELGFQIVMKPGVETDGNLQSCIYNTDPEWLSVLAADAARDNVNFWRKDKRHLHIAPGSTLYFRIRGTGELGGRAVFREQVDLSPEEAWHRFGTGNGVSSLDKLHQRAREVLKLSDGALLNCLVLDDLVILPPSARVKISKEVFPPSTLGAKYFNADELGELQAAFRVSTSRPNTRREVARAARSLEDQGTFDPKTAAEARDRVMRSIAQRRGQAKFRQSLLAHYAGKCAVTGTDVSDALEAAHICRYQGTATNHLQNGLLLRGDLHTLFDLGLWTVDEDYRVRLSATLKNGAYAELEGRPLSLPAEHAAQPSAAALATHRSTVFEQGEF